MASANGCLHSVLDETRLREFTMHKCARKHRVFWGGKPQVRDDTGKSSYQRAPAYDPAILKYASALMPIYTELTSRQAGFHTSCAADIPSSGLSHQLQVRLTSRQAGFHTSCKSENPHPRRGIMTTVPPHISVVLPQSCLHTFPPAVPDAAP